MKPPEESILDIYPKTDRCAITLIAVIGRILMGRF